MTLNAATPDFIETLRAQLPDAVRPFSERYAEEPRGRWAGQAAAVVAPATTAQVADVMRLSSAAFMKKCWRVLGSKRRKERLLLVAASNR